MQRGFNKVNDRLIRRFAPRLRNLFARLLLLAAPQIDEDHQHPRFSQLRINRECAGKSDFGTFVIFRAAKAFEDSIDVRSSQAIKGQRKVGIEFDRTLKVFDRSVAVFLGDGAENEPRKEIAPAQVLLVSCGVLRCGFREAVLLGGAQFKSEALHDSLRDLVLYCNDVFGGRIYSIAPKQVAGADIQQLCRYAEAAAGVNKARRQHRVDAQLASNVARVKLLSLVFRDHRRRSHHERAHAREFGYHSIGKRKLIKARGRIVAQVAEAENGQTLLLRIGNGCKRRFVNGRLGGRHGAGSGSRLRFWLAL